LGLLVVGANFSSNHRAVGIGVLLLDR
jgi:hypothetical protein